MSNKAGTALVLPVLAATVVVAVTTLVVWKRFLRKQMATVSISELYLYPIKSCAELSVDAATPTPRGFQGDRIAQVTDKDGRYCTPRDRDKAKLFHVQAELWGDSLVLKVPALPPPAAAGMEEEPPQPQQQDFELNLVTAKTTPVTVEVLEAVDPMTLQDYGEEAAAWMEQATGIVGCRLTGVGPDWNRTSRVNPDQGNAIPNDSGVAPVSLADEAPYLLTNQASLDDLNQRLQARGKDTVDMRRFRPNMVLVGLKAWEEDCLKKIRIHGVEFWVWQRCGRCTMTTVDRDTLQRGPEPLATLSTFREREHGMRNFGMHLIPVEGGIPEGATIQQDDEVEILEYDQERRQEWQALYAT
jgi:uncharacterized protein YcbX